MTSRPATVDVQQPKVQGESGRITIQSEDATGKTRVVEVPVAPSATADFGWRDVAVGISNGSWAVLLTLGLVYAFSKNSVNKLIERYLGLMQELQNNLKDNSETLKQLQQSNTQMVSHLNKLQENTESMEQLTRQLVTLIEESKTPTPKPPTNSGRWLF